MTTFKLEIQCDTVAFGERPELHIADILHGVANTVRYVGFSDDTRGINTPIHDVNGNRCGKWELKGNQ